MALRTWIFCFALLAAVAASAQPEEVSTPMPKPAGPPPLPKWELGAAGGLFYLPDYPGASESRGRSLILPYGVYRGEVLRADREGGVRGRFCDNDFMECDLSFGAAFPSRADDNEARENMEDIDWAGEVGPRVTFHLHKGKMTKVDLQLPLRYVFTTDLRDFHARGFVFHPEFKFSHRAFFSGRTFFSFSAGPIWATEKLHDLYYEVSPDDVTAERRRYNAKSGYMGFQSSLALVRQLTNQIVIAGGVGRNFYADAENRPSPLLRDIETESYFLVMAWTFVSGGVAGDFKRPEPGARP